VNELFGALILFVPRILGALAIGVFGIILAVIARRASQVVLNKLGLDALLERLGVTSLLREGGIQRLPSWVIGTIIFWIVLVLAILTALGSLGLDFLAETLNQVFLYAPRALAAIILLIMGTAASGLLADFVGNALDSAGVRRSNVLTSFVRYSIIFIAILLAASVLQIDITILIVVTVIVLGGAALTAALALGLGLKSLSQNVAAGRYLIEGVAEGDRIAIDGVEGTVEQIGYAITTLRNADGRVFLIPNAHFMEHIVEKAPRSE
jgi:small-conductance mechanosensitive channel